MEVGEAVEMLYRKAARTFVHGRLVSWVVKRRQKAASASASADEGGWGIAWHSV